MDKVIDKDRCIDLEQHMDDVRDGLVETRADIKSFGEALGRVERKVFNGFGSRIEAVNDKLDDEKRVNAESHKAMQESIATLNKFLSGALITIVIGLVSVFAMIWTTGSKTEQHVQELEKVVIENMVTHLDTHVENGEVQYEVDIIQTD